MFFLNFFSCANAQVREFSEKQWKKELVKNEKEDKLSLDSISSLQGRINKIKIQLKQKKDSLSMLDSALLTNHKTLIKSQRTDSVNSISVSCLLQRNDSLNRLIANTQSKNDKYLSLYIEDKLNYPWTNSARGAIEAIDSINEEKVRLEYSNIKSILQNDDYKNMYEQMILVLKQAQSDSLRTDPTKVDLYKEKMSNLINSTVYVKKYVKGGNASIKIPFLDKLYREFLKELRLHKANDFPDFRTLISYDRIENM